MEDEIHFLLQCPKLEIERSEFIKNISLKFMNFKNLDVKSKFIWLMTNEDHFVNKTLINMLNILTQTRRDKLTCNGWPTALLPEMILFSSQISNINYLFKIILIYCNNLMGVFAHIYTEMYASVCIHACINYILWHWY